MRSLRFTLLAAALVSCETGGTRSVETALPTWEAGPEELRIGSVDDPDHAFGFIRMIEVDRRGGIYSTHSGESRVRRWTVEGAADGFVGREGEGPGEFTDVRAIGLFGDSLWVMDSRANRISFFDLDATFLGSLTPEVDLGTRDAPYPLPARPEYPLRGGGLYGRSPAFSQAVAVGDLTWTPHVRMDAEGTVTDTIYRQAHSPEHQLALLAADGQGGTFGPQPFPDGPVTATDLARDRLLVLERGAWAGAGPAAFTVTALGMRGDTLWRLERVYDPVPLPAERVDSAIDDRAEALHGFMSRMESGLTVATVRDRVAEAVYRPAYLPAATGLVAGRDGSVWIQLAALPEDPPGSTWLLLDEDGEPTARIRTPPGLRVLAADREHVWGVVSDEFDVNYIVRHAVGEAGGG